MGPSCGGKGAFLHRKLILSVCDRPMSCQRERDGADRTGEGDSSRDGDCVENITVGLVSSPHSQHTPPLSLLQKVGEGRMASERRE